MWLLAGTVQEKGNGRACAGNRQKGKGTGKDNASIVKRLKPAYSKRKREGLVGEAEDS